MAPRLDTKVAIPVEAYIVNPSTLGPADGPVVPDGDYPGALIIPCDAVSPADDPVI